MRHQDRDPDKNRREVMQALSLILQIGLAILVCMAMSIGIGVYLNRLFGVKWILIVFMVIGIMASIRSMLILTGHYHPGAGDEKETESNGEVSPRDRSEGEGEK